MAVGGRWHLLPLSFLVILFFFLEPGSSASLPPNDQILSTFSSSSFPTLPSHRTARDGCPQPPPCQQPTKEETKELLVEFFHATSGPTTWRKTCGHHNGTCWLSSADFCNWYGVTCFVKPGGVQNLAIRLPSNSLVGQIPASWARLCTLAQLDIRDNFLGGNLPAFGSVMAFPDLAYAIMSTNAFEGPLPAYYGGLSLLTVLDISRNYISGPVPMSLSCLRNLDSLTLSHNLMTGQFPELFARSELTWLDVSDNEFIGPLPTVWNITQDHGLVSLSFARNNFTGLIPQALSSVQSLSKLVLSHNQLIGTIPQSFASLPCLQMLMLNDNQLEGQIPTFQGSGSSLLMVLDVSNNVNMTGTIGDDLIAAASSLAFISIKGNTLMRYHTNSTLVWISLDYNDVDTGDGRAYWCPTVVTLPPYYFRVSSSPEFVGYSYCSCGEKYYGKPPHQCSLCPVNCMCQYAMLWWSQGFYPILNGTEVAGAMPCTDYGSDGNHSACNPSGDCSAAWGTGINPDCVLCSPGTSGRLCSRCQCPAPPGNSTQCFFRANDRCIPCTEAVTIAITVGVCGFVVCLAFLLLAGHAWRRRLSLLGRLGKAAREVGDGGALKICIVFAQTTAAVNSTWPEWALGRGMRYLDLANFSTAGTGIECLWHWMSDPVWNLTAFFLIIPVATALVGAVVLARVAYLWGSGRLRRTESTGGERARLLTIQEQEAEKEVKEKEEEIEEEIEGSGERDCREEERICIKVDLQRSGSREASDNQTGRPWDGGIYAWLWIAWFLFFELANRSFDVFNCVDELKGDSSSYMDSLPWLRCSSDTEWSTLQKLSISAIVIYVAGIPLVFAGLLFFNRNRLEEDRTRYMMGNLFACYRPEMRWFELVVLVRRLLLAALLSLVAVTNPVRPAAIVLVLLVSLSIQHSKAPFASEADNRLEEAAIGTVAFTFATQMLWKAFNQLNSLQRDRPLTVEWNDFADILTIADDYASALVALVLVLNLAVLVVLLAFVLRPLARPLVLAVLRRGQKEEKPQT